MLDRIRFAEVQTIVRFVESVLIAGLQGETATP